MKTVIFGATTNPQRYAYEAANRLSQNHLEFVPVGIKKGEVFGQPILDLRTLPPIDDVHTITMYMNAGHQNEWFDYLLSLKPTRIIFNPGAENPKLAATANELGIITENACTLVMLSVGAY
jgi:predicted CoA-binding protein